MIRLIINSNNYQIKCDCKNPDKGFLRSKINFIFHRKKIPAKTRLVSLLSCKGSFQLLLGMPKCGINQQPHFSIQESAAGGLSYKERKKGTTDFSMIPLLSYVC